MRCYLKQPMVNRLHVIQITRQWKRALFTCMDGHRLPLVSMIIWLLERGDINQPMTKASGGLTKSKLRFLSRHPVLFIGFSMTDLQVVLSLSAIAQAARLGQVVRG